MVGIYRSRQAFYSRSQCQERSVVDSCHFNFAEPAWSLPDLPGVSDSLDAIDCTSRQSLSHMYVDSKMGIAIGQLSRTSHLARA